MRNFVMIALFLLGTWVIATGIADSDLHIVAVLLLTGILCMHIWNNRKIMGQRLRGLGWSWILIGLIIAAIVSTTVFDLITDAGWQPAEEDCTD
jgi:hypothetical protein